MTGNQGFVNKENEKGQKEEYLKQDVKNQNLNEKDHFELARITSDARWSSFFARIKALKFMNIALLIILGLLVFNIISISTKPKVIPYIIEINQSGRIANYGRVLQFSQNDLQGELVQYYIENFFKNIRNVDADPVVVKRNWARAYDFCTDKAANILNKIYTERKPLDMLNTTTVEIRFTSYLDKSAQAKEIEWAEDFYDSAGIRVETKHYRALLTYIVSPANVSVANPSGFFIESLIIGEKNND